MLAVPTMLSSWDTKAGGQEPLQLAETCWGPARSPVRPLVRLGYIVPSALASRSLASS